MMLLFGISKLTKKRGGAETPADTDQLEVRDAHRTLVVHLLLVFILNQTLHQVTCVHLVVSYILHTHTHTRASHTPCSPDVWLKGAR